MKRFAAITVLMAWAYSPFVGAAQDHVMHKAHAILMAEEEVTLSSEMGGRIIRLPFQEGQTFHAGDILAEFSCDVFKAELSVAQTTIKAAQAELKNAKHLDQLKAAGKLDLLLAQAALDKTLAEKDKADGQAKLCQVVAPFDGKVLSREVRPYESVDVMTPIIRIGRDGPLRVTVIAPSSWLSWIKVGSPFTFSASTLDQDFSGVIDRVGASVDAASQTVKLEGVLEQETLNLLPGLSGSIQLHQEKVHP